ncbi:MAG TPA: hypothetical protein DEO70_11105 [Bacteroidales bacterium]|nr:MAG: hypothetical protein A2X11_05665 [Bacteroidetes bacterium GWE2_42_24]OFY30513.1 MAG: hypothetical protein A2X09_16645 [Bacteroidetes bacterium GWF2_43_11]HBZ67375.1 hypothetical protein [Bacteroidales bacterium]
MNISYQINGSKVVNELEKIMYYWLKRNLLMFFFRQIVNDAERLLPIMAHGGLVVREVAVNFQNDEKNPTKAFR